MLGRLDSPDALYDLPLSAAMTKSYNAVVVAPWLSVLLVSGFGVRVGGLWVEGLWFWV